MKSRVFARLAVLTACIVSLGTSGKFFVSSPLPQKSRHQPIYPPYDFRSRPFAKQTETSYMLDWIGVENGQNQRASSPWKIETWDHAAIQLSFQGKERPTMSTCQNGTVKDTVHVILEGPAILGPVYMERVAKDITLFTLTAYDAGVYNVNIELIIECSERDGGSEVRRIQLDNGPVRLHVEPGHRASGFPATRCTDLRWRHGRWMECHTTPLKCVRTGWVWVPNDCYVPILTRDEIVGQRPMWVVFAGSSIERGTFLSLVDYLLASRAANLTESDFWKCWGWMDLQIGNLRISYLDFRAFYLYTESGQPPEIVDARYAEKAVVVINDIGHANAGSGPDLFHLEIPDWYDRNGKTCNGKTYPPMTLPTWSSRGSGSTGRGASS